MNKKLISNIVLGAALSMAGTIGLHAQSSILFTNGAEGAVWSDENNWQGGTKPGSSQSAAINGNSGQNSQVDEDFSIAGIIFSGSTGRTVVVNSGIKLKLFGSTLLNNAGNQSFSISGTGQVELNASGIVNVTNASRGLSVSAQIVETGGSRSITKQGAGTFNLNNLNTHTFSGGVIIEEGGVSVNTSSSGSANAPTAGPLGTGTITLAGGALYYRGSSDGTLHNALKITADSTIGDSADGRRNITFLGDVDLSGGVRTLTIDQHNPNILNRRVYFSGVVSNGGLIKRGIGSLELRGNNTYSGDTVIENGQLTLATTGAISSSGTIAIQSSGDFNVVNFYELAENQVVTGDGKITGNLRIGQGVLRPGDGVGKLTISADTYFHTAGTIEFELGVVSDQLVFTGDAFSLQGNSTGLMKIRLFDLGVENSGTFVLMDTSGLTNATFSNWGLQAFTLESLPTGWDGELAMDGNNLVFHLNTIPEPGATLLLGIGLAGFGCCRRKQRNR